MVTDTIETFTEDGIRTTGGQDLRADVIITARDSTSASSGTSTSASTVSRSSSPTRSPTGG